MKIQVISSLGLALSLNAFEVVEYMVVSLECHVLVKIVGQSHVSRAAVSGPEYDNLEKPPCMTNSSLKPSTLKIKQTRFSKHLVDE